MSVWNFYIQRGLWIGSALIWIGVLALVFLIVNVVKLTRKSVILRVPVLERQELQFPEAGRVILAIEGPLLTSRFARFKAEMTTDYGSPVSSRLVLMRTVTSGARKSRMDLRVFQIPHPGRFVLLTQGYQPDPDTDEDHRLVFTRPQLLQVAARIVGMVVAGMLIVLGVLLIAWRTTGGPTG